jgi:MFS transporter, NNP family, nitrate/nitrite transporter
MNPNENSPFPLRPVLLLVAIFYLTFVCRVALAPLLPVIEVDLGLGHGGAGSLFLFVAIGFTLGLFISGLISSWLTHRITILLAAFMAGVTMAAISQASSLGAIRAGLVVVGIFAGIYLPSGIATLTELVSREHWGKAMAVHEMAPNLAFFTAPLIAEVFLRFFSWRLSLALIGGLTFLSGVLFLLFGRGGKERGKPPSLQTSYQMLRNPSFWLMALLMTIAIASSFGIYTMMPLFLVNEMGMSRSWANTIVALSRSFGFVSLIFSGFITDRFGPPRATIVFLGAAGGLTLLLGLVKGPSITPVMVFLQAASVACLFPVGFTAIALSFPTPTRSIAVAKIIMIAFLLGGGFVPLGIGYWAEAFSFSSAFSLLAILFLASLPLFIRFMTSMKSPERD